jgi:hypothetical protein
MRKDKTENSPSGELFERCEPLCLDMSTTVCNLPWPVHRQLSQPLFNFVKNRATQRSVACPL